MIYRRFYIIVILRVIMILATSVWFSEAIRLPRNIYTLIVVSSLLIVQVISLIYNINSVNRSIGKFFDGIQEIGSSVRPHFKIKDGSFRDLSRAIGRVANIVDEARIENERQLQYFRFVVENSPAGIMIADQNGKIDVFNKSAEQILKTDKLFRLSDLENICPNLAEEIEELIPGYKKTLRMRINNSLEFIQLRVAGFRRENEELRIISLQNLTHELEENELISWQKLTRVLTHEIMNSLTPIASLTEATKRCLSPYKEKDGFVDIPGESIVDALLNLKLIEDRSAGIKDFVRSYKRVSQVPVANLSRTNIKELIKDNIQALRSDIEHLDISISEQYGKCPELDLDEKLLNQVMTNLIKNSTEALYETKDKKLRISTICDSDGVRVEIVDNGRGIPPEEIDDIFMPFYTTRSEGVGIGLSLSRQIMRLHKGSISVASSPGVETKFVLKFPGRYM